MNKFINVCGFGNTGCTAQADYLSDFENVKGVLAPENRNRDVINAPYQEFGILKCIYSFGGVLRTKLHKLDVSISKSQLKSSLLGREIESVNLDFSASHHLALRKALFEQYGSEYRTVVEESLLPLPENFDGLTLEETIALVQASLDIWCEGVYGLNLQVSGVKNEDSPIVLGLKNDPTGAFPLISSILSQGRTSAMLRNPFDTCWDFNRHYKIDNNRDSILRHCNIYNSQLNSARSQISNYRARIADKYFVHNFEDFVANENHRKCYSQAMLGRPTRTKVNSYYSPEKSIKNVGVYQELDSCLVDLIEEHCFENYVGFKDFLKREGLLLTSEG